MTPSEIKQANTLIEDIEALEELATSIGSAGLIGISLTFRNRDDDRKIGPHVAALLRNALEQAIAQERQQIIEKLRAHYGVDTAA
ncbi:hypothetical protein [Marinobacterium litorale]|uniref:hypothetical protein n=1 Tax=Marinobacterium litorale TaxID=404770 RepID=UPI0004232961|nr:hypothetical protein [Marinobacterium litorale]